MSSTIPSIKAEPGEDNFSFKQQQKRLKSEHEKRQPNEALVDDLMTRSFGMRRADIIENGYVGVAELFKEYPFLQNVFQVFVLLLINNNFIKSL